MMPHDIPYYQFKMVRMDLFHCNEQESPSHENTGLLSSGVSLISWGEGVNLTLVGHPSSECHNKNILWGRCFTISTTLAPYLFLLGWLNLNLTLLLDQLQSSQIDA